LVDSPLKTVLVRVGAFAALADVETRDATLAPGDSVVVRTKRGREWGEVLSTPRLPGADLPAQAEPGRVLRRATASDRALHEHQQGELVAQDYGRFRSAARRHDAALTLLSIERLFGNERVIFYVAPRGIPIEEVHFDGLSAELLAHYGEQRVEIREVGETVREHVPGCGSGGGCDKEGCSSKSESAAPPPAAPRAKEASAPTLRALPMISRSGDDLPAELHGPGETP
jgi:cell fate regulator YaaT (PSP1 superfamily)